MKSLFNKKQKSTSTSSVNIPSWLEPYITDLPEKITDVTGRGFTPYGEDLVAGLTPDEQAAYDIIRQQAATPGSEFTGLLDRTQALQGAYALGPTTEDIERLSNPFTDLVIDRTRTAMERGLASDLNRVGDQAAQIGAFGGARQGVREAETQDAAERRFADVTAGLLSQGYDQALENFYRGLGGAQTGLQQEGQVLQARDADILRTAAALESAGATQRGIEQQGISADYNEFLRQQAFPYENLNFEASNLLNILNLTRGQTNVATSKESGNYLGKAVGMATSLASLGMGGNTFQAPLQMPSFGAPAVQSSGLSGLAASQGPSAFTPLYGSFGGFPARATFKDGGFVDTLMSGISNLSNKGKNLFLDIEDNIGEVFSNVSTPKGDFQKIVDFYKNRDEPSPTASSFERLVSGVKNAPRIAIDVGSGLAEAPIKAGSGLLEGLTKPRVMSEDVLDFSEEDIANMSSEEQDALNEALALRMRKEGTAEQAAPQLVAPLAELVRNIQPPVQQQTQASALEQAATSLTAPIDTSQEGRQPFDERLPRRQRLEDRVNLPLLAAGAAMMSGDDFGESLANGINAYIGASVGLEQAEDEREQEKREQELENRMLKTKERYADIQEMFAKANLQKALKGESLSEKEIQELQIDRMKSLADIAETAGALKLTNPELADKLLTEAGLNQPDPRQEALRQLLLGRFQQGE